MQIVITNYDNSCGEQVMIGKKFYKLHTEGLQDAIYMRNIRAIYEKLIVLLDAAHVRESDRYHIISVENEMITDVMMTINHEGVCDYSIINVDDRTEGRESL